MSKIILILLTTICLSYSQTSDGLMQMALDHFGTSNNHKLWWIKDMSGHLDFAHPIRMVLITDTKEFKGAYELLSSKERYYLDGQIIKDQLHLIESDSTGRIGGSITGEVNEDEIYGTWTDYKNTENLIMYLHGNNFFNQLANNDSWITYYKLDEPFAQLNQKYSFFLEKKNDKITTHFLDKVIEMDCLDHTCSNLINVSTNIEQEEIKLNIAQNKLTIKHISGNEEIFTINPAKKINYKINSFIDYDERWSFLLPEIEGKKKFAKWSSIFFEKFFLATTQKAKYSSESVAERFKHIKYGDLIVDCLTDSLFSGIYLVQSSDDYELIEVPFIFDFKKDEQIFIKEIFNQNDEFYKVIEEYYNNKSDKVMNENTPIFSELIFTLNRMGLQCRTKFSTIYGREEFTIPFEKLNLFINNKGPLARYGNFRAGKKG